MLLAGASAIPARAQDAGNTTSTAPASSDIETVTVTGSRISRSDYVSDTPLTTATADVIASAGSATLETSLNTLPQLSTSASSSASFVPSGGQANLDLRGMGSQRTLVLLNGRRLQPSMPTGQSM
jgi:outer membrane cobalamin receptor